MSAVAVTRHRHPSRGSPLDDRYAELFRRHYPELVRLAGRVLGDRVEAEDAAQETLAKLAKAPVLERGDSEVAAWLRRVCLNDTFNRLRSRRRHTDRVQRAARLAAEPADGAGATLAAVLRREVQAEVREALWELPERQRTCLVLRHSGYSYTEIAEALGIAVGSVGVLLGRAERAFRRAYRPVAP